MSTDSPANFDVSPLLRAGDQPGVAEFLRRRGWIDRDETLHACEKAGEGNMNLTLRVTTDRRSVVLKQSRPWVEKYPQVEAPADRILFEHRFYQRAAAIEDVARLMPEVLAIDAGSYAMLLEDLGEASDFTTLYEGGSIRDDEIDALAAWAASLHEATRGAADPAFANRAMRSLNHQHIFVLPLSEGLPVALDELEPGLGAAAESIRGRPAFVDAVERLGRVYLDDGPCVLQGDYYPGSWLRTTRGVRVIDPEFCFFGPPEFEMAVSLAHLALAGQPWSKAAHWLEAYRAGGGRPLDEDLLAGFAGVEVMRRIIGLAQLPLPPHDGRRIDLLQRAEAAVTERDLEALW